MPAPSLASASGRKGQSDALLVSDEINVGYLSGFSGDSSYLEVHDAIR